MTPFNIVFLYYFLLKKIYQQIKVYVKYIFFIFQPYFESVDQNKS